jgi:hypothetical protein
MARDMVMTPVGSGLVRRLAAGGLVAIALAGCVLAVAPAMTELSYWARIDAWREASFHDFETKFPARTIPNAPPRAGGGAAAATELHGAQPGGRLPGIGRGHAHLRVPQPRFPRRAPRREHRRHRVLTPGRRRDDGAEDAAVVEEATAEQLPDLQLVASFVNTLPSVGPSWIKSSGSSRPCRNRSPAR